MSWMPLQLMPATRLRSDQGKQHKENDARCQAHRYYAVRIRGWSGYFRQRMPGSVLSMAYRARKFQTYIVGMRTGNRFARGQGD